MVQPKTPPMGIRPNPALRARVEAYAARHGISRHAALLKLIEKGLRAEGVE
jgi:hypothetical protein